MGDLGVGERSGMSNLTRLLKKTENIWVKYVVDI